MSTASNGKPRATIPVVSGAFGPAGGVVGHLLAQAGAEVEPAPPSAAEPPPVRPVRRRTRPAAGPAATALVPAMPDDRYVSRQQLNIRIDQELHWALRASAFMTNASMTKVLTNFLTAYAADPQLWLDLFRAATAAGTPLSDVLNPAAQAALVHLDQDA